MPTNEEREYYSMGYRDGLLAAQGQIIDPFEKRVKKARYPISKPKRKLSAWQKYIKNPRNHIKYRDGKLNLKKMGVAYRRKRR